MELRGPWGRLSHSRHSIHELHEMAGPATYQSFRMPEKGHTQHMMEAGMGNFVTNPPKAVPPTPTTDPFRRGWARYGGQSKAPASTARHG